MSEAVKFIADLLHLSDPQDDLGPRVDAVGFRVVHGADKYVQPALITDAVLAEIEKIDCLAPLHNRVVADVIRQIRQITSISIPLVAVFDTMFFAGLPDYVRTYAVSPDAKTAYSPIKYGFHGLAHEHMRDSYVKYSGFPLNDCNIVSVQLGSGCSVAAIKSGVPFDTSMGFTPLEGLVMRTRSGDVDPGLIFHLMREGGLFPDDAQKILTQKSGLAGLSGHSGDMRQVLESAQTDPAARLALNVFCYRAARYIGGYLAVISRPSAIVFGGGIGENSPQVRSEICGMLKNPEIILDDSKNNAAIGKPGKISHQDSVLDVYVFPPDESEIINKYVLGIVGFK